MIQGMGGLMSVTGEPDGMPMKVGVALVDVLTGTNATSAILAALIHAERTGEGQHIDMSLFDVSVASLANQALNHLVSGTPPGRLGNAHPNIVPYQAFATSDGHIILAVGNDSQFTKFCTVAGLDALALDKRFATNSARVTNREALVPHIEKAFGENSSRWWLTELEKVGVPAGPINSIDQVLAEPQAIHRGLVDRIADTASRDARGGTGFKGAVNVRGDAASRGDADASIPTIASPLRLQSTPPRTTLPPPRLGAHNREILGDLLGMNDDQVADLAKKGTIF